MEELQRLIASRRGHRSHLTKLMKKSEEMFTKDGGFTELELASAKNTTQQLEAKAGKLRDLDEIIAPKIEKPEDLEEEIMETEEIQEGITDMIAKLSVIINNDNVPSVNTPSPVVPPSVASTSSPQSASSMSQNPTNIDPTQVVPPSNTTQVVPPPNITHPSNEPFIPQASNFNSYSTRLPKLNLPVFSGDPLEWMTFWDSFNVAVHSKPGLPDVDKFNYLKAQVSGEAEQAIGGYLISGDNYVKALATLKERFGQTHRLTNAHMTALLYLQFPTSNLESLRPFCDALETNIRALEALGKSQDSFGELLIPVILGKLPNETKRNLARTQQGGDWTIQGLREALKHELMVLEAGSPLLSDSTPTASFFTGVKGPHPQGKGKPKVIQCVYCKRKHSTHNCATVSDPKARKDIVVKLRLCYNCLSSSHISSKCTSKFRCRQCRAHQEDEFDLQQFWSLESMGISPNADPPEKNFLTNYQATSITRDEDGTYIAGFPWKEEHAPLPTNFSICERRTRATARRLHQI
ncbi:uncharacterized protein LOC116611657 [Nematostella vectensis]|nr:uncharacterized protein LOC116611657 [Nematostella vectensis]